MVWSPVVEVPGRERRGARFSSCLGGGGVGGCDRVGISSFSSPHLFCHVFHARYVSMRAHERLTLHSKRSHRHSRCHRRAHKLCTEHPRVNRCKDGEMTTCLCAHLLGLDLHGLLLGRRRSLDGHGINCVHPRQKSTHVEQVALCEGTESRHMM